MPDLTHNTAEYVWHDFEYGHDHMPICGHFLHHPSGEEITLDFRHGQHRDTIAGLQQRWRHCVWASFAAHAEMTCLINLGLSLDGMAWLDLFAEARQITGSHTHFYTRKGGLIQACQALGVPTSTSSAHKEAMRLLILDKPPEAHSEADWNSILRYCAEDVRILPHLWEAISQVHCQRRKSYPLRAALFRSQYVTALAKMEHASRGFPVDTEVVNLIFDNHRLVRKFIAEECNAMYGGRVFNYVKREDKYTLHLAGIVEYVDRLDFPVDWKLTKTGRLDLSSDYLDEFCKRNPHFEPLRDTLALLSQLKSTSIRDEMKDGFIKGVSIPYYTATGRNQPLTSRGFVLNLPPWLRHIVRPKPDHVLVMADYAQEEIYLAAALSGDTELRDALLTGDVYIALAKMADAVPFDATKESHPTQRQAYKSTQLGVGYGMGAVSLGKRIFLDQPATANTDFEECMHSAVDILRWHKQTFRQYWRYVEQQVMYARKDGWIRARDGWTQFADQNTRFTKLQNFPMQANGAVILREAIKLLSQHPEIELVCTLHDSIMIYCHADDEDVHTNILRNCMIQAVTNVMRGLTMPMDIPVEVKSYTHEKGYVDKRGTQMFNKVMALVRQEARK